MTIQPETLFRRCCQRTELPRGDTGRCFIIERWRVRWPKFGRPTPGAATKLLLEYTILTAARSGEPRLATWSEVDLHCWGLDLTCRENETGREHRIPLSTRALKLLIEAQKLSDGSGILFPSLTGKALSSVTTRPLLNGSGIDATMHGFRTSFRSWCAENDESRELAEAALAHVVGGVEGAYMRSDLFERRRRLSKAWANYLGCAGAG